MEIKNEHGTKWVSCDNLGELITEFKKFRNSKSANERKKYQFGGGIGGDIMCMLSFGIVKHPDGNFSPSEIVDSAKVYQENGVDLSLKVAPLNFKEKDWNPYHEKVKNILKEIWETGEVKNYQGLDLNWPAVSKMVCCDQCRKNIDGKLAYFSDREKDLDFCSEICHFKWKEHNASKEEELKKQLKKETNHKIIWMVIAIGAVGVLLATFLILRFRKKRKTKNNL